MIVDAQQRKLAINPHASYLVQAPAGSGKTELLIQRILALLATVHEPEEVLALTFTRKAAAEMRERVLKALFAAQRAKPQESHAQTTWQLAVAVLAHSEKLGWRLIDYPARLRIMTLDAFASGLARQLPVLSGFGQAPATADFAEPIYQQATDDLLDYAQQKQTPKSLKQAINTLILHQDCKIEKLKTLLASMLSRREQWLPDVLRYSPDMDVFRTHLEQSLEIIIQHSLSLVEEALSPQHKQELFGAASFAAKQLSLNLGHDEHLLSAFVTQPSFPTSDIHHLAAWKALANLLLTGSDQLRKTVNKNQGFDTSEQAKPYKQSFLALLATLSSQEHLIKALAEVRRLPDSANFDDQAWFTLEALFTTLKLLAVHLWQSFEQHKQVDFVEVMLRAKQALGQHDAQGNLMPSDALLRLDHQIKHILIDEFQDTSTLQIDLLSRLTAGWAGDGRSLFMVGDPMQSIYRFRKAEVSLFLKAANNDLPAEQKIPPIQSLKLAQNFRSSPDIVAWVNKAFANILPAKDDVLSGAIAYTPCQAFKTEQGSVSLNILNEKSAQQEADLILTIINTCKQEGKRVGVLARSRNHLQTLMQTLQHENIAFRAVDILPLHKQPEIIDLLSLTAALLHPADHVAWASLLRSPLVGLSLSSLFQIYNPQPKSSWLAIQTFAADCANTDEKIILQRFVAALEPAVSQVRRLPLRKLLESTWLRLAGPATLNKTQLSNTDVFFNLVERLEQETQLDIDLLKQRLQKLYAKPEIKPYAEQVELLTMHGAKGLQWDTVILCGLGKTARAKDKDVLVQTETNTHQGKRLLLSPLPQHGKNQTYELIRNFEKERDNLEIARLLYVACTRAEHALHLFGEVNKNDAPASSSLLALLMLDDMSCFDAQVVRHEPLPEAETAQQTEPKMQRLTPSFAAPQPFAAIASSQQRDDNIAANHKPEFSWAGVSAKAVGIALHAALQQLAEQGIDAADNQKLSDLMRAVLHREGMSAAHLDKTLKRCEYGLQQCLHSERAQWILADTHQEQHNEWALTYAEDGVCKHLVLDRSFIDTQGTRWIIDYKTGSHRGEGLDDFLDQELIRYTQDTPQLPNYVKVVQALEPQRKIKAALYFPMVDGWRVWQDDGL